MPDYINLTNYYVQENSIKILFPRNDTTYNVDMFTRNANMEIYKKDEVLHLGN
jgi:hypothetical protein